MPAPIETHLNLIRNRFESVGLDILDISGSFRVTLENGYILYIYSETYYNRISLRVETKEADSARRAQAMERLHEEVAEILCFAHISAFELTQTLQDRWAYTACLEIENAAETGLEPIAPPDFPSTEIASIEELQELLGMLDRYMLENRLDWMYIPPSSRVRAALEAILKSKTDKQRLKQVLKEQARQLSGHEAAGELELIKQINNDHLLQPLVNLLCRLVYAVKGKYQPDFRWNGFFR